MGKVLDFFGNGITRSQCSDTANRSPASSFKLLEYRRGGKQWLDLAERDDLCKGVDSSSAATLASAVVDAYGQELKRLSHLGIVDLAKFPDDFCQDLRRSKDFRLPAEAMAEMRKLTIEQKANIVLEMMSVAHRVWANSHQANFFSFFIGREIVYLPMELFGPRWLQIFFDGMRSGDLADFGLDDVMFGDVLNAQRDRLPQFLKKHGAVNFNSLALSIPRIADSECDYLSPEIKAVLGTKEVARSVALQVFTESPQMFKNVC